MRHLVLRYRLFTLQTTHLLSKISQGFLNGSHDGYELVNCDELLIYVWYHESTNQSALYSDPRWWIQTENKEPILEDSSMNVWNIFFQLSILLQNQSITLPLSPLLPFPYSIYPRASRPFFFFLSLLLFFLFPYYLITPSSFCFPLSFHQLYCTLFSIAHSKNVSILTTIMTK